MRDGLSKSVTGRPAFLFKRIKMNELQVNVDKFVFRVAHDYYDTDSDVASKRNLSRTGIGPKIFARGKFD